MEEQAVSDRPVHLNDLDLPEIDMFDADFARDPHATFARARSSGAWLAKYQRGYIPLDMESIAYFFKADDICRMPNSDIVKAWNAQGTTFARFFENMVIALGGAEHSRLRRIVAPAFTPREANKHRDRMRQIARETIAKWMAAGECDFGEAIGPYSISVVCDLIGIRKEDVPKFAGWLDKLEASYAQDARALPAIDHAISEIFGYIDTVLAERRSSDEKRDDLLQKLMDLTIEGGLTDEELRCLLTVLMGAGYDTTKNQLTFIMYIMTQHPEHWERVAADPSYAKPLIEESLRYMTPIGAMHRVTKQQIEYRGVIIPQDTFISLAPNAAGRDPKANSDPERFDPERKNPAHVAFGQGEHFCLGHFIARGLLEEAVPILAKAVRAPRLSGERVYRSPMGVWSLEHLPIAFTPGSLD